MNADSDYEDLSGCGLSEELEIELLRLQRECVFMWSNSAGEPFGVIMSLLPKDDKIWLTCAAARKRVPALKRFPRASICLTSTGTKLGPGKTITYKGECIIRDDQATKDWFYPEFSRHLQGDGPSADLFRSFLDSPDRVIIEFTPDYKLGFDADLMMARSPGAWGT